MNATQTAKIRTHAQTLPTNLLIDTIEILEDRRATLTEDERFIYAINTTIAAKRLGLNVQEVARSFIGPAAYLRVAAIN